VGTNLGVRGFCVKPSRAMCCFLSNRTCSQSLASCDGCLVGRPAYGASDPCPLPMHEGDPLIAFVASATCE
jgi:hypothetical protein